MPFCQWVSPLIRSELSGCEHHLRPKQETKPSTQQHSGTFHIQDIMSENQRKAPCYHTWLVSWPNQSEATIWSLSLGSESHDTVTDAPCLCLCVPSSALSSLLNPETATPLHVSIQRHHTKKQPQCIKGKDKRQAASSNSVCHFAVTWNSCSKMALFIEINFNIYNQLYGPVWKPPLDLITVSTAAVEGDGFLVSL